MHNSQQDKANQRVIDYLTDPANYPDMLQALEICDGHTIFDPHDFDMLPEFIQDHFSTFNRSDPTGHNPKHTIYLPDNSVAPELYGIYGLDLIEGAAKAHKIQSTKNGRGFRAKDLTEKLRHKLAPEA